MALRLYNTLGKKKEAFKPLKAGNVTMYTCGPTVHKHAHLGNFKSYTYEYLEVGLNPFGQRVVNLTVTLSSTDEDESIELQVVAKTKDLTAQENSPGTIEVEGRPSAPGASAIAAMVAVSIVALLGLLSRRRRRP